MVRMDGLPRIIFIQRPGRIAEAGCLTPRGWSCLPCTGGSHEGALSGLPPDPQGLLRAGEALRRGSAGSEERLLEQTIANAQHRTAEQQKHMRCPLPPLGM